ncbi:hypothetical protein [Nostoc sp. FACHB-110]|uniref:hypothetical protein n=1 Tax=Nostoc sp. FACHB-110 TaxID=2692834 RepID=UPI00168760B5|nr:hypothetical protein [Nostoc sp. FACHB-110]MBD2439550.1 hypothetical protein [Nostoc sp. FACHB-110]
MVEIKQIVQQAFRNGYLSTAEQNQIQALLRTNYDSEDLDAFIILQRAIAAGELQREPHRRKASNSIHNQDTASNIKLAYKIAAELAYTAALALSLPKNTPDQPSLGA